MELSEKQTMENRVVLIVVGGGTGIGLGMARIFAQAGASVYVSGKINKATAKGIERIVEAGYRCEACPANVTKAGEVTDLKNKLSRDKGRLDILINAGGLLRIGKLHEISETDFLAIVNSNIVGTWLVTKTMIPLLAASGSASVINISSPAATQNEPGMGAYEAAKSAVNTMTKVMAKELSERKIRVNGIAPGPIETKLFHGSAFGEDLDERTPTDYDADPNAVPFGRAGLPNEVARLAMFLTSPESDFISGSITTIDGALGY